MSTKKIGFPCRNGENARRRPTCENASKRFHCLSFPVLLCSRHACKNRSKSSKIHHKIITKNTKLDLAMVKCARRRPTCEKNIETRYFCCSRCCFAHAMDAKIAQNRRKSWMEGYKVSTVGPAARRANSKCIKYTKTTRTGCRRPSSAAPHPAVPRSPDGRDVSCTINNRKIIPVAT